MTQAADWVIIFLAPTLVAPVGVLEQAEKTGTMPEWALSKTERVIGFHKESVARAHAAGVRIAMGTDSGVIPHGENLRELGLMVDIGMSTMEAIVASTKVAAECLAMEDQIGTIERGKLADVVLV
ncbi:MAG: amidohydrolase family protein [Anaerolineae bacterium]